MAVYERIGLRNGKVVQARRVRHLGTLTPQTPGNLFGGNAERDIYREDDGTEHVCQSPTGDCRVMPREE